MGTFPNDRQVWKSTRHHDFSKVFCTFIWKSIQNTHKIGEYWERIDNYGHRANCQKCGGITESLEHTLLQCDILGQRMIWERTKKLWLKRHGTWPDLTNIGTITGYGLIEFRDKGKPLRGENRAYRILISESAHFIWKLRCAMNRGTPVPYSVSGSGQGKSKE